MNTTPRDTSFAGLFGTTWNTFKSNYGLCLGLGILALLLSFACAIAGYLLAISASSKDSMYSGAFVAVLSQFILFTVILTPLITLLSFKLITRVRGEKGIRSGWFSRVFIASLVFHVILLPGLICSQFGNPTQYEQTKLIPEMITAGIQAVSEKQDRPNEDGPAFKRAEELQQEINTLKESENTGLVILGGILSLVGLLFAITWLPWAALAACDPREVCQGASETLRRGSEIAAGAKGSIIGSYVIVILIAGVTLAMCLLPGVFFGFPLAFAWMPAVYLLLRDTGAHTPPVEPA